jgi:hypothetical protein
MKKIAVSITLCLLLTLMARTDFANLTITKGQVPHLFPEPLIITIDPQNNSKIYNPYSDFVLTFNVSKDIGAASLFDIYPSTNWFSYSLDNKPKITGNPRIISRTIYEVTSHNGGPTQIEKTQYKTTINLQGLSQGQHNLTVYISWCFVLASYNNFEAHDYPSKPRIRTFDPIVFYVDYGYSPNIQVNSPEKITYDNLVNATSITFKLKPGGIFGKHITELQKGDNIEGTFSISNLGPYKNSLTGENQTYIINVKLIFFNSLNQTQQTIQEYNKTSEGFFNYTAPDQGNISQWTYCSVREVLLNANTPEITFNYEIEPTLSPTPNKQTPYSEVILGASIIIAVLGASIGLLLYLMKKN